MTCILDEGTICVWKVDSDASSLAVEPCKPLGQRRIESIECSEGCKNIAVCYIDRVIIVGIWVDNTSTTLRVKRTLDCIEGFRAK